MEIKKIQIKKTIFISNDGKEFKTQEECIHYEAINNGTRKVCDKCDGDGKIDCNNDFAGDGNWGSSTGVSHWQEDCKNCNGRGFLELNQVWS